jgi:subtilisin family serine protease
VKRYIIRSRAPSGGTIAESAALPVIEQLSATGAEIVKTDPKTDQHVVKLSKKDAAELAAARPDLIVEEDQPIDLFRVPGLPEIVPHLDQVEWEVVVRDASGAPIEGCTIFAIGPQVGFRADTDAQGLARLTVQPAVVQRLVCSPHSDFWSRVVRPPIEGDRIDVVLDGLDAGSAGAWWLRLLGLETQGMPTGHGVSVCVIDTGVAALPQLVVTGGLNTLDGEDPASFQDDQQGHGTHVAGVIAGRMVELGGFRGIAPDVTLYAAKVFPGGFVSDIIEALDWCREQHIDLVNMSLGSRQPSPAMAEAVTRAVDAGVTIVVAAGNDAGPVAWPGALPDVITVGAAGKLGSFPADSGHSLKIGAFRDWYGRLFSASFTNRGPEVDVCAPGVAIASTVPQGFAAWDGTSMACPMITGLLALALESAPWLRTGTRYTPDMLAALVASTAAPTGMPQPYAGTGLLTAPRLLAGLAGWG